MRLSVEEVIEVHNGHISDGLSISAISSLRRIHGLNKFEEEPKVYMYIYIYTYIHIYIYI
jgi:hypothetical protein